jgi:hypothetical protein
MEQDEGMFKQVADRIREQRGVPEGAIAREMTKRMEPGRGSSKIRPRRQTDTGMLDADLKAL